MRLLVENNFDLQLITPFITITYVLIDLDQTYVRIDFNQTLA